MSSYYSSCKGLSNVGNNITHLFSQDVRILASYNHYYSDSDLNSEFSLKGRGRYLIPTPPKIVQRELNRVPYWYMVQPRLRHLGSLTRPKYPLEKREGELYLTLQVLAQWWFLNSEMIEFLLEGFQINRKQLMDAVKAFKWMPSKAAQALEGETLLHCAKNSDVRNKYFKKLELLEYCRCVFDCVAIAFQAIRKQSIIPSLSIRSLARLKKQICNDPEGVALRLKNLAFHCRKSYFLSLPVTDHLVSKLSYKDRMQFSYVARGLPSPLKVDDKQLFAELKERLTSQPPQFDPEWKEFLHRFFAGFKSDDVSYEINPSVSGAIGYNRSVEGHSAALQAITLIGFYVAPFRNQLLDGNWGAYFTKIPTGVVLNDFEGFVKFVIKHVNSKVSRQNQILDEDYEDVAAIFTRKTYGDNYDLVPPIFASGEPNLQTLGRPDGQPVTRAQRVVMEFLTNNSKKLVNIDSRQETMRAANRFASDCLIIGCKYLLEQIPMAIVEPLTAPERGLKTRIPTKALTFVNVLQGVLRSAMDSLLRLHPSISQSLGGNVPLPLQEEGPFYSIDLSTATDYHPHWLTTTAYQILVEKFCPELYDFDLEKLLGPKFVLEEQVPPPPECSMKILELVSWINKPSNCPVDLSAYPKVDPAVYLEELHDNYLSWLKSLYKLKGYTTTVGQMMGDPTSFPIMPLVTLFVCEKVGSPLPYTCGDDGVISKCSQEQRELINHTFRSLGSQPNESKGWYSQTKFLFRELVWENGNQVDFHLLSLWTAPPGASKGTINWYNLPASHIGDRVAKGLPTDLTSLRQSGLYKYTKFQAEWDLAQYLGLPLGAVGFMGGINHPQRSCDPIGLSWSYHCRWYAYLSSLPVSELVMKKGLTLVPPNTSPVMDYDLRQLADFVTQYVSPTSEGVGDTVQTVFDRAKDAPTTSWIFHRGYKPPSKAPAIHNVALGFRKKLSLARRHKMGSYEKLYKDLVDKRTRLYTGPEIRFERSFGIHRKGGPVKPATVPSFWLPDQFL